MSTSRRRVTSLPRAVLLASLLAAVVTVGSASPAYAADNGDWQGGFTTWFPQNCLDRSAGVFFETGWAVPSHCLNSVLRDSNFNNERYGNLNAHPLNDHAIDFRNNFVTLNLRAYHDSDYNTGSSCIGPLTTVGPYPVGVAAGLSSFKSC